MPRFKVRQLVAWSLLLLVSVMSGCALSGPATIRRDHFDYSTAISESWKSQALLNIVKMRYLDQPVFLEVKSVVAGYNWEHTGTVTGTIIRPFGGDENELELGYEGTFVERPTISYSPLGGAEFVKAVLTPIEPSIVLALVDSGWPASRIFETMVQSVNGRENLSILSGVLYEPDPAFTRFMNVLQKTQRKNALTIQMERSEGKVVSRKLHVHRDRLSPDEQQDWDDAKVLLGLSRDTDAFDVVWGTLPENPNQLAIKTRSVLHVLAALAVFVDVPKEDLELGFAPAIDPASADVTSSTLPLMHIHTGSSAPKNPYAAVRYNGKWFWVDGTDTDSKRTFGFLNLLLTIMKSDTGATPQLVITTN